MCASVCRVHIHGLQSYCLGFKNWCKVGEHWHSMGGGALTAAPPWKGAGAPPASPPLASQVHIQVHPQACPCPSCCTNFSSFSSFPLPLPAALLSSTLFPPLSSSPSSHSHILSPSFQAPPLPFPLPPSLFLLAPIQYLDGWHLRPRTLPFLLILYLNLLVHPL